MPLAQAEVEALLARAVWPTDVGTALLFENEWCRAWDFTFPPGGGDDRAVHQHCLDYVFCFPCGGTAGQIARTLGELERLRCRLQLPSIPALAAASRYPGRYACPTSRRALRTMFSAMPS